MITVADLIAYRRRHDKLVERVVSTRLPTEFGEFHAIGYRSLVDDKHHVVLVEGEVAAARESSCASTRSASPATSSARCGATAATSSTRPWP